MEFLLLFALVPSLFTAILDAIMGIIGSFTGGGTT